MILRFVSREELLAQRGRRNYGRWWQMSHRRECTEWEKWKIEHAAECSADKEWERRHPKATKPARVLFFQPPDCYDFGFEAAKRAGFLDPVEKT